MPRKPIDAFAVSLMVVLCVIWGMQQVAIKLVAADMSPLLQVGMRSGVAALVIAFIVLVRREHAALGGTWKPGLLVGTLFGLEFIFIGEGLRFTNASHMAIFLYTAPLFAALGLHLMRPEERLNMVQWAGIFAAFAGVVLSFAGRGESAAGTLVWLGDLLGILAGAFWGATTVVVRGSKLSDSPASLTLLYQLLGGFLLASGAAAALGQTEVRVTPGLLASLGFQSIIVAVISYLAWFMLLRTYLASRLGVLTFLTPIFGVIAGVVVLSERLEAGFVLGALLIMGGILLVSGRDVLLRRRQCSTPIVPST